MNSLREPLFNPFFSHIYIEDSVKEHPDTLRIVNQFPNAIPIGIKHYKDVFCRSRQNYVLQKQSPSLILAKKSGTLIYPGAPVCQSFGNQHFYYTSCMMNCIFDCEYCYLQGMYSSGHIVVFLNLEDVFNQVDQLLVLHPVYLCVSYDTDLLAFESVLGYAKRWCEYAASRPNLTIEIRTKSGNDTVITHCPPSPNTILSWTLSPEEIISRYEHHTASLTTRLSSVKRAIEAGWQVRICFEPILYEKNWQQLYKNMIHSTFQSIPYKQLQDVSLGVFRVSHDYLKRMQKQRPDSPVLHYPFQSDHGVFHYGKERTEEMVLFLKQELLAFMPEEKLFIWKGNE